MEENDPFQTGTKLLHSYGPCFGNLFSVHSPGSEPPSLCPLPACSFPKLLSIERHPRPCRSTCGRCRSHPRLSAEGRERNDRGLLLYDRRGVHTNGRRRTHPAAGLVAERPSLLTDGSGGQSLILGRGGQLLVVSEPVQHAVALAGFGGHSRHPAVEAEQGSITTVTLNIPTVARQHGKVHHRSDDTNIPAEKSTPESRLHKTLNSFQLFR